MQSTTICTKANLLGLTTAVTSRLLVLAIGGQNQTVRWHATDIYHVRVFISETLCYLVCLQSWFIRVMSQIAPKSASSSFLETKQLKTNGSERFIEFILFLPKILGYVFVSVFAHIMIFYTT